MFLPMFHKDLFLAPFVSYLYLSHALQCNAKLFADDTSLFATVHNINKATNDLENDLTKITKWDFQCKMSFNPDISKQAHEIIFFRKGSIVSCPRLNINNIPVAQANSQKHLGMQLDKKLSFEGHLSKVKSKVNKTISIIRKLQNALPRSAHLPMHKSFIRSYLNYEDIINNKAFNQSFLSKLE